MNFVLQRFSDNRESTLGLLFEKKEDGRGPKLVFQNYTLEDEYRDEKVSKDTRIPAGFYELKIMETVTPLTLKYQQRYPAWFKKHIEVTNIKGFRGVYCHIGNKDEHTDGCILFGDSANNNTVGEGGIMSSTESFRRWYGKVYDHLAAGKKAFIEIRDEDKLL